ncbi:hypothetical protein KY361_04065, partial [Candidatus Woesearchaeota archaeon]|nr:hypothetical protein [Candidatus Woesearchaeota archaeon]
MSEAKELKRYIKDSLDKGYTLEQIKKALIKYGYNRDYSERLINSHKILEVGKQSLFLLAVSLFLIAAFVFAKNSITGYAALESSHKLMVNSILLIIFVAATTLTATTALYVYPPYSTSRKRSQFDSLLAESRSCIKNNPQEAAHLYQKLRNTYIKLAADVDKKVAERLYEQVSEIHKSVKKQLAAKTKAKKKPAQSKIRILSIWLLVLITALIITNVFVMRPTITAEIVVMKEVNYTDSIGFKAATSSSYAWYVPYTGNLTSLRLKGKVAVEGHAKVYLEHEGEEYLIFDSLELEQKMPEITGYAVLNETNQSNEAIIVRNETALINESIGNETALINETFVNETVPINETLENKTTPVNESFVNETAPTVEGDITIVFEYNDGTNFDIDNDGIEDIRGAIDFTVKDSIFRFEGNEERACTKWEIYSKENEEITIICQGNDDCCALIGVAPFQGNWDDPLYLTYGRYGATLNNIVTAQVIYADYSFEPVYSEIYYSDTLSLNAGFIHFIDFEDFCIDTCVLPRLNASSYSLRFELMNDSMLYVDQIDYTITSLVPVFMENITANISYSKIRDSPEFDVFIDELYEEGNDLVIAFHHDAVERLDVKLKGKVKYDITKKYASKDERVVLTVSDFGNSSFRLIIGKKDIEVYEFGVPGTAIFSAHVKTSEGKKVKNATIRIIDDELGASYSKPEYEFLLLNEGFYDIEIRVKGQPVERILLEDAALYGNMSSLVDVDNINLTGDYSAVNQMYAIDAAKIQFENAIVTIRAKGDKLYKCRYWNFSLQKCASSWRESGNLTPGESYNLSLSDWIAYGEISVRYMPAAEEFDVSEGSTEFFGKDLNNITNLTLANNYGKIKFPDEYVVNVTRQDYDKNVKIGRGFVSVNSSALHESFNHSSTITLKGIISPETPTIYYAEGFYESLEEIIANGKVCDTCYNITYNASSGVLTFIAEHLSSYGTDITIINPISHPEVGNNWTVEFNTTGTANLTITVVEGLPWINYYPGNNSNFSYQFLELRCGDEILNHIWINRSNDNHSVFYEDYSCNETGYETSYKLAPGHVKLEFRFGGDVGYADNDPFVADWVDVWACPTNGAGCSNSSGYIAKDSIAPGNTWWVYIGTAADPITDACNDGEGWITADAWSTCEIYGTTDVDAINTYQIIYDSYPNQCECGNSLYVWAGSGGELQCCGDDDDETMYGSSRLDDPPDEGCSNDPPDGVTCDETLNDGSADQQGLTTGTDDCCRGSNYFAIGTSATDDDPSDTCTTTCTNGRTCWDMEDYLSGFAAGEFGICVSASVCDVDEVCNDGVNYLDDCYSCGFGDECDTDLGSPMYYLANGVCAWDGGGYEVGNYDCDTDEVCDDTGATELRTDCSLCDDTDGCENGVGASFSADGICLSDNSCDDSGHACLDSTGDLYKNTCSSCGITEAEANRCDTSIIDGEYTSNGVCTDSNSCTTGALYDDEGTLKAGCSGGSDVDPCDSAGSNGWSVEGICVSGNACDGSDVATVSSIAYSCSGSADGYSCDTDTLNGQWEQDSMCLSDTNNGGSWDCKTTGHACYDGTYYEDTCASCNDLDPADNTLTSGDFSKTGICCSGIYQTGSDANSDCCADTDCAVNEYCDSSYQCTTIPSATLSSVVPWTNYSLNSELGGMTITWSGSPPTSVDETYVFELHSNATDARVYQGSATTSNHSNIEDNYYHCYSARITNADNTHYSPWAYACNITRDRTGPDPNLTATGMGADNYMQLNWTHTDEGLVLYMPFEEGGGTSTDDWSATHTDGTLNDVTWNSSGKYGKTIDFPGISGDNVALGVPKSLNMTKKNMTVMVWFKPKDWGVKQYPGFIGRQNWPTQGWLLFINQYNYLNFRVHDGSAVYTAQVQMNLNNGTWYHATGRFNGSHVNLYLDGELIKSTAFSGTIEDYEIGSINIGNGFNGSLDELRVYQRALTQQEIIDDMQSGLIRHGLYKSNTSSGTYKPLDGYWDDFSDGDYTDTF